VLYFEGGPFLHSLDADIRRISNDGVEAAAGEDEGEFGAPVEGVDTEAFLFVEEGGLLVVVEVGGDEGVATLDVGGEVWGGALMEELELGGEGLAGLGFEDLEEERESLVTSTACGSISTPKMLARRMRLRSAVVRRQSLRGPS